MMESARGLWRQPPGARYDIRVKRGGRTLDLVLVHGRGRPDATGVERSRTCAPVPEAARAGAPPPSR